MDLLEELTLARRRITDNADVDVTTKMHALVSDLVHTTQHLEQDTLLDVFVTKDIGCNGSEQLGIQLLAELLHLVDLLDLFLGKVLEDFVCGLFLGGIAMQVNVGRSLYENQLSFFFFSQTPSPSSFMIFTLVTVAGWTMHAKKDIL